MDVTANMDIQGLEKELELSMLSPMALSYSDLRLYSSWELHQLNKFGLDFCFLTISSNYIIILLDYYENQNFILS